MRRPTALALLVSLALPHAARGAQPEAPPAAAGPAAAPPPDAAAAPAPADPAVAAATAGASPAAPPPDTTPPPPDTTPPPAADAAPADAVRPDGPFRNGLEIYQAFRDGLAEPGCAGDQDRWRRHFAHAPARLADPSSDVLPLFGYVVDALREVHLPTEFALIPFIESGYAPAARSRSGPAGLWQFISLTARNHGVRVASGYDGRLSPAESTTAAVRYLKTLNGMFGGNWRLTAMAYNAGESRVLQALRRSGSSAVDARPGTLGGLSPVTYAYVDKLHALACLLERAGEQPAWRQGLDRPVARLRAHRLEGASRLDGWAGYHGQDAALLRRLNPALAAAWPRGDAPLALVQGGQLRGDAIDTALAGAPPPPADPAAPPVPAGPADAASRTHTVRRGESAWAIARRYGIAPARLLELNGLKPRSLIKPGMVLRLE